MKLTAPTEARLELLINNHKSSNVCSRQSDPRGTVEGKDSVPVHGSEGREAGGRQGWGLHCGLHSGQTPRRSGPGGALAGCAGFWLRWTLRGAGLRAACLPRRQ